MVSPGTPLVPSTRMVAFHFLLDSFPASRSNSVGLTRRPWWWWWWYGPFPWAREDDEVDSAMVRSRVRSSTSRDPQITGITVGILSNKDGSGAPSGGAPSR